MTMEKVGLTVGNLPARRGDRPRTHPVTPHEQLDQISPGEMRDALYERMRNLPGVVEGRRNVSLPTSKALRLDPHAGNVPYEAFMVGREFVHLHGYHDGSMHLALPPELRDEATERAGPARLAAGVQLHRQLLVGPSPVALGGAEAR